MGKITAIRDTLKNFIASLNTDRDKQSGAFYAPLFLTDDQLSNAFRTSWMARKVVSIPAQDATRKWREWNADKPQIELIENAEKDLGLQAKVLEAIESARLYGGAGIYFSITNQDPSLPLDPRTVKKGQLEFITVLPRRLLTAGEIETDPLLLGYGKPKYYTVSGGNVQRIHPSRLAIFFGAMLPDPELNQIQHQGWGDSSLIAPYDAVRNADSIAANIASLVYEAKVDILKIPGLGDIMADPVTRTQLQERVMLAALLKSNNGMLVIDSEEEHDSKTFTFAGLTDICMQALQAVAGAADIPVTRFLGQTPSGLSSTGESDLKNYYDSVNSIQTLHITPALKLLDEALIYSALGTRPLDIYYQWSSLWQMSDEQKATISKSIAETIKILSETRLFPDDDLSEAAVNMLIEHSIMPTLKITGELEEQESEERVAADESVPRTLYVSRRVLNASDITAWAKKQGIRQTLKPETMHVTIAFSRKPVDWTEIGSDWSGDERGRLKIKPGGPRIVEQLGEAAKVLKFSSDELEWRHKRIIDAGASWDFPGYTPHITITYGGVPKDIEPYVGPIILGPEIFEELDEDWQETVEEVGL
jgi:hypothetical protein